MNVPIAAFVTLPASWGILPVGATASGIVAVDLGAETPFFVDDLSRQLHGTVLPAEDGDVPAEWRAALYEATRQLGAFLAGTPQVMTVATERRVSGGPTPGHDRADSPASLGLGSSGADRRGPPPVGRDGQLRRTGPT